MGEETKIQKEIIFSMAKMGFFVWKNHTQAVRVQGGMRTKNPNAGSPDIMAIKEGRFYAIEVKTKTGKLDNHQRQWLINARSQGAITMCVRSLDDLIKILDDLKKYRNEKLDNVSYGY